MAEDFCGTDAPSPGKACMQSLLTRRDAAGFSVALKQAGEKKTSLCIFYALFNGATFCSAPLEVNDTSVISLDQQCLL